MDMIYRYLDSLLKLPTWIGFPIFYMSIVAFLTLVVVSIYLLVVTVSPWFLLSPLVIWAACAINWWIKNKNK